MAPPSLLARNHQLRLLTLQGSKAMGDYCAKPSAWVTAPMAMVWSM